MKKLSNFFFTDCKDISELKAHLNGSFLQHLLEEPETIDGDFFWEDSNPNYLKLSQTSYPESEFVILNLSERDTISLKVYLESLVIIN